jgi:hypothetical protein
MHQEAHPCKWSGGKTVLAKGRHQKTHSPDFEWEAQRVLTESSYLGATEPLSSDNKGLVLLPTEDRVHPIQTQAFVLPPTRTKAFSQVIPRDSL